MFVNVFLRFLEKYDISKPQRELNDITASSSLSTIYSISRIKSEMEVPKMSRKKVVKMLILILSALLAVSKHMELDDETATNE